MRRLIHRTLTAPAAFALICLLALPLSAFANTSEAIAQTGGMTVTLPMPGSGLSVVVQLDVVGNISQVTVDPVGTYTATRLGPHAMTFDNTDGSPQVKIKAKGDKLAVKASAPTLASFLGSGTWSADLFGTHETTDVGYTVGAATDGSPTVTIDSVAAPGDVTVVQGTPKTHSGPKGAEASAKVDFSRDGFTKKLEIKVSVKADHGAKLDITLSGKDKQKLSGLLADLAGPRSWAGHLCDGTAVAFTYDVVADGTVAFGAATGAPATTKVRKDGFQVVFDNTVPPVPGKHGHDKQLKVSVKLHEKKDGTWELKVDAKAGKCKHTPAADPTVNTPVAPDATKHDHHDGHDASEAADRHGNGHKADDKSGGSADTQSHRG